ncbi:MAG: cyclic nucleotide-binding domain-containing protein [Myxococcota bacterium]
MPVASTRIVRALGESPLFAGLPPDVLSKVAELGRLVVLPNGKAFIREGDAADLVYVLVDGEVDVVKVAPGDGTETSLALVGAPHAVGELALFDDTPRTATVRARGTVQAVAIPIDELRERVAGDDRLARHFLFARKDLTRHVREGNERLLETMSQVLEQQRLRLEMGRLTIVIIVCLCFYTFALDAIEEANDLLPSYTYINIVLTALFVGSIWQMIARSHYGRETFGITTQGGLRAVAEAVGFTGAICAVLTLLKAGLVATAFPELPLFELERMAQAEELWGTPEAWRNWATTLGAYVFFIAPMQEFIVRGGLQSAMVQFFEGRRRRWMAILLSNLIFCTTHLVYALPIVAIVFFAGLYWGWLYDRHRTLIGVSVSHAMLGAWAFWFLGIGVFR